MKDWAAWHRAYDDPDSSLSRRLQVVRGRIGEALDALGPGPRRILSLCSGDGRDLLPVLVAHPRRADLSATLVELDEGLASEAADIVAANALDDVVVNRGDAGVVGTHYGPLPVDLLLLCGIFGNISDEDIRQTIAALPAMLAPGATVIWTRAWSEPDLRPQIRSWLQDAGMTEIAFDGAEEVFGVGVHRLTEPVAEPAALPKRLFTFAG